jgi:ephrin-B
MMSILVTMMCLVQTRLGTLRAAQLGEGRLANLYWNTSNPIFRIDNTDHIIDVNYGSLPHQYQQINIYCPYYTRNTRRQDLEHHLIYNVGKEEFDTCRILSAQPRIVAYCTQPYEQKIFTLSFRSFSPMPNTMEFHPGQDYYFISTASPGDIHRMVGGYCTRNHMKIVFKVMDTETYHNLYPAQQEERSKERQFSPPPAHSVQHTRTAVSLPTLERVVTTMRAVQDSGGPRVVSHLVFLILSLPFL